jgi:hypothetical protein
MVKQAFSFDGTSLLSTAALPVVTSGVSVEAWIRSVSTPGRIQAIMSRWDFPSTDDSARSFELLLTPDGRLQWSTDETSAQRPSELVASMPQLLDGSFHHVAATWDRSAFTLYVDGLLVGTKPSQGGTLNPTSSVAFQLGGELTSIGTPFYFNGSIDEPAIYGRALSGSEIAAIYNAGVGGKCP